MVAGGGGGGGGKSGNVLCQFGKKKGEFVRCKATLSLGDAAQWQLSLFDATAVTLSPRAADAPAADGEDGAQLQLISTAELLLPSAAKQSGKQAKQAKLSDINKPIKAKVRTVTHANGANESTQLQQQQLEHAFRLDLGVADSGGVSRYVIACSSQVELLSWRAALERACVAA